MALSIPGTIRVLLPDGEVRRLGLEEYVRGVVAAALSADAALEALKAQAVAARTFGAGTRRHIERGADVCTLRHCQVWKDSTTSSASRAAEETRGIVAAHGGRLIDAYYFEHCDGNTRDAAGVLIQAPPYLKSVTCACGFSTLKGHGIGMCQRGALVMARFGDTFDVILKHYFSGIELERAEWVGAPVASPSVQVQVDSPKPAHKPARSPRASKPPRPKKRPDTTLAATKREPAVPPSIAESNPPPQVPLLPQLGPPPLLQAETGAELLPPQAELGLTPPIPIAEADDSASLQARVEQTTGNQAPEAGVNPVAREQESAADGSSSTNLESGLGLVVEDIWYPLPEDIFGQEAVEEALEVPAPPAPDSVPEEIIYLPVEIVPIELLPPPPDSVPEELIYFPVEVVPNELPPSPPLPLEEEPIQGLSSESPSTLLMDRLPGPRMIAGDLATPGIVITIRDVDGHSLVTVSGTAPHHGPGGFEAPLAAAGAYAVNFRQHALDVTLDDETVFIQIK